MCKWQNSLLFLRPNTILYLLYILFVYSLYIYSYIYIAYTYIFLCIYTDICLSISHFLYPFILQIDGLKKWSMEKEMATHSSILAWKSPWTEETGWLQSMGLHDWACVHKGGGRWVGSNKVVGLKKKMIEHYDKLNSGREPNWGTFSE